MGMFTRVGVAPGASSSVVTPVAGSAQLQTHGVCAWFSGRLVLESVSLNMERSRVTAPSALQAAASRPTSGSSTGCTSWCRVPSSRARSSWTGSTFTAAACEQPRRASTSAWCSRSRIRSPP